jgi:hypothetical protein
MEPKFTSDGDGTVTAPSSLMLPAGGNMERYWLDLYRYNNPMIDFRVDKQHKDILEVSNLLYFLSSIIKTHKSSETLPKYISSQKPGDYEEMKPRIRMSLYSPLDIHLYDEYGNHTGPIMTADGKVIEENIPNTYYKIFGEQKYVGWSTEDNIRVELAGYAEGSYAVKLQEVSLTENGEEDGDFISLENLPVISGTQVGFDVPSDGLKAMTSLSADYDGDGSEDYIVVPKINSSATLELSDEKNDDSEDGTGDGIDDGQENDSDLEETDAVKKIEKKEEPKIDLWSAYLSTKTSNKNCQQRLNIKINGRRLDDNVMVFIGNQKAKRVEKRSNRKAVAIFCLDKLLNKKTGLERSISVENPKTKRVYARKKIDLNNILSVKK